jgi:hypothetical protein
MSLPVSCPLSEAGGGGGGPPCTGSPSPVDGYSEAASSAGPFCSTDGAGNLTSGGFSSGNNNYSPFDPAGGYPVTSSSSSSSIGSQHQLLQSHDRNHNHPLLASHVPGKCGRPGCLNPVNKATDGTESTYCSSECVVGQCREVYTSWATTGSSSSPATGSGGGQHSPSHHHHLLAVQPSQQSLPPPPQVK